MWIVQLYPCCIMVDKMELNGLTTTPKYQLLSERSFKAVLKDLGTHGKECHLSTNKHGLICLRKKFNWHPTINNRVESEFKKLAAYRMRGMISHAKKEGEKPEWIFVENWTRMQVYWATPKAKPISEKARTSRMSDRNGLGPHSHLSGSRSYAKVQDVLQTMKTTLILL